jgi:hypothetical protein
MRERSDFRRPRNVLICFSSLFQGAIFARRGRGIATNARFARIKLPVNIHPNNRGVDTHRLAQQQAVPQSDCLWQSCTAHKRCHISLAASHQRREHSHFRPHCLRLTQYQRQLPRLSPHVPPLIQLQHPPEPNRENERMARSVRRPPCAPRRTPMPRTSSRPSKKSKSKCRELTQYRTPRNEKDRRDNEKPKSAFVQARRSSDEN